MYGCVTMLKCSPVAFAKCPTRQYCGSREEATFTEDSECAKFNELVAKPLTNGDRVRNMADDELAIFMAEQMARQKMTNLMYEGISISEVKYRAMKEQLYFIWIRWLLSEAEEEKE